MLTAKFYGCLAMLGVLCLGAGAADNAADEKAIEVSARDQKNEKKDTTLASRIQADFSKDPLFSDSRVKVDLYDGLAIVHGSTGSDGAIPLINEKLKSNSGVIAVYNYMSTPDRGALPGSFDVTMDDFKRLDKVGTNNSSFAISQRVKDRLDADPRLEGFEIDVDTYHGLVILHGSVADESLAKRARDLAAYAQGVDAVLSYIDVSSAPSLAPVTAAPIYVRPGVVDTIPAAYEVREVRVNHCATCK
jgi:hyperosmotically inducible protein